MMRRCWADFSSARALSSSYSHGAASGDRQEGYGKTSDARALRDQRVVGEVVAPPK
jgi:hypothetical protein